MKYEYIIWHDNDFDLAFWVKDNSILKDKKVQLRCIPKTNKPSQIMGYFNDECTKTVMKYIRYETPDVIIQKIDGKLNPVVCVTELMTHTPQWQHPAQRFTRLYTSSILKTPTALIIPQRKIKWEKGSRSDYKATPYTCSPSVYQLFVSATNKNKTPTLIFNWPNFEGYLIYDEKHQTSPFIDEEISKWFDFINKCIEKDGILDLSDYESVLNKMKSRAEETLPVDFETIRGVLDTDSVIKEFNLDKSKLSSNFLSNKKTLVFAPNGLKCSNSKFRTDPYAGMLCAFDIMFCRDSEFKRNINLLLIAKNVKKSEIQFGDNVHENEKCPFINQNMKLEKEHLLSCSFTQAKYRRIYGEVADVIIFDDTIYYNGGAGVMALTEYDVCFATKEYLFNKNYIIVTWNPPGSQGTFTIPNPEKDPTYKGQTGSESPDLIAIKDKEMLFVEAKDNVNSSYDDIIKLQNMLSNPKRKALLFKICSNQMLALGIDINFEELNIRYAVAVPYEDNIKLKYKDQKDLTIFSVKSKIDNWDNKIIDGNLKVSDIYEINEDII